MKPKLLLIPFIVSLFLASCGKDGVDGNIYFAIFPAGNCIDSYDDDNSSVPYGFSYGYSYGPCSAGSYNYTFTQCDGYYWYGTYSIYKNRGTEGGFLHKGDDGPDRYFKFMLSSDGGSVTSRTANPVTNPEIYKDSSEVNRLFVMDEYTIRIIGHRVKENRSDIKLNMKVKKLR